MFRNRAALVVSTALLAQVVTAVTFGGESGTKKLENTALLTWTDDIAARLVAGVDRFLLDKLAQSVDSRPAFWHRDTTSADSYNASIASQRPRLARLLGVRAQRHSSDAFELVGTLRAPALIAASSALEVYAVRWQALRRMHGEGLLLVPVDRPPIADIVAIPDADQTPEQVCGIVPGVASESQFPRLLAESGCRVLVPVLIDRKLAPRGGRALLTSREYLYRSAFELGRHLIGYEIDKIRAGIDCLDGDRPPARPTGVVGWGEGGMLALYSAALDTRIDATCVSGYFEPREQIWKQPIDRNVFGLLEQFGDAEIASLIAPRHLLIEAARGPELTLPSKGGAPGVLATPNIASVRREWARARAILAGLPQSALPELAIADDGTGPYLRAPTLTKFLTRLLPSARPTVARNRTSYTHASPHDALDRAKNQLQEIDDYNQWLLRESPYVRSQFMKKLDTSSLKAFNESTEWYRDYFREEVVGHFSDPLLPPHARTRQTYRTAKWTGYEVVLDVFPNVIAYGILLLPNDLPATQRRPVVVCQHGLEGRPQQVVTGDHRAYHDFAARLAEQGFITFAPQNLYIFGDRFRTLQRKAYPLKKTLFSIIVPQHQQIVNWLKTLPNVDPDRIAFYGLSYGGKTAMRVPPLVPDYCLSICSGDFNEWVWKNASTRSRYSYVWTGEYEIFEFDLGSTFNYAEMATLIAPRPFMVERGHADGVAPDEMVAHEFAKVRRLYQADLKIPERCAIEWFNGPHMINGKGTFAFLHHQLNWPER